MDHRLSIECLIPSLRQARRAAGQESWVPRTSGELVALWQGARESCSLGQLLSSARRACGLSLLQLQTASAVEVAELIKLEYDLQARPALRNLVVLAEALGLTFAEVARKLPVEAFSLAELEATEALWQQLQANQPGNPTCTQMLAAIRILKAMLKVGGR
jgi:transcriptional regulator with XRE-family HTH domain